MQASGLPAKDSLAPFAELSRTGLPALEVPLADAQCGGFGEQEALWTDSLSEVLGGTTGQLPDAQLADSQAMFIEEEVLLAEIRVDTVPLYANGSMAGPNGTTPTPVRPILSSAVRNLDWEKLIPEWVIPDRRRCERIAMDGVAASAIVLRGEQKIPARVLDLSFGGMALDFEEHWILPNEFCAELRVPVWPAGTVRLLPIYANLNKRGMRVGCRFATKGSREKMAGSAFHSRLDENRALVEQPSLKA